MKKKWLIILLALFIVALIIILYLLFGRAKSFTITFDTNGGTEISDIKVKDGGIIKLPESPKKEGYTFIGWTNEEGKVITRGTKVTDDITLKAEWISNDAKTNSIEFDTDGGNVIDDILIENGKIILLPVDPIKDGYIFICWVDENGNFITKDMIITENITLKAKWMKKSAKTVTLNFDTNDGGNIESIKLESGKKIILPINPTKAGYVFAGWTLENGDAITKDYIIDKSITIKAVWKDPYTCPDDCTPIGDGRQCTKTTTKDLITYTGCPSGTETIETFCSSHKSQTEIVVGEDVTYVTTGIICNDNPSGYCVNYNGRYTITGDSCPSGYYKYTDSDGFGALYGCVKKSNKGGSSCPSGYTQSGNVCKKTETISCKAN